jgi:phosphate transport system permease protein
VNHPVLLFTIVALSVTGYYLGRRTARRRAGGRVRDLHSLPSFYGSYVAIWCGLPALFVLGLWLSFEHTVVMHLVVSELPPEVREMPADRLALVINDIENLASGNITSGTPDPAMTAAAEHYNQLKAISFASLFGVAVAFCLAGITLGIRFISPALRARVWVERAVQGAMILCSTIAIFTTIGIVLSVLFESLRFFQKIPIADFLFGLKWSPQVAIRADQVGSSGAFGVIPLLAGTFLISAIALLVAVPIGLFSAIYMSEYAGEKFRSVAKPVIEILAGIPTVVYGFFAALTVAPFIRRTGELAGMSVSSESALAAGLVMGVMIIPFVSSLSDDVISAVPQSLRDASLGVGATQSETIVKVLIPSALPGIVGSILLAASRAIGETMIVVMAAGLTANLTANPLQAVTTVTVQIVTLLVGDQEFDSSKTLAAFALGLILFIITLCLNVVALYIVRRYREQYE